MSYGWEEEVIQYLKILLTAHVDTKTLDLLLWDLQFGLGLGIWACRLAHLPRVSLHNQLGLLSFTIGEHGVGQIPIEGYGVDYRYVKSTDILFEVYN